MMSEQRRAIALSLVCGVCILVLKMLAYLVTDSAALMSDAFESIVNVVASAFTMWTLYVAQTPPDRRHPYGHGRVEFFAVFFEGALVIVAALGIIVAAAPRIIEPRAMVQLDIGLGLSVVASAINLVLGLYLIRVGRREDRLALVADGKHIMADVYTTGGVLAGLLLVHATGWLWLDGAIACVVALHILGAGYGLVREAVRGLMNERDEKLLLRIEDVLRRHEQDDGIATHDIRAWRSGRDIHVDLHLVLPRHMTMEQAQARATVVEDILRGQIPHVVEVLVRAEACDEAQCSVCRHAGRCHER